MILHIHRGICLCWRSSKLRAYIYIHLTVSSQCTRPGNQNYILASLDIDKAFLEAFTHQELAQANREQHCTVCFKLPPGSAAVLRTILGFEHYDETIHCLQCVKPGTGTKDAPRALSLKLRKTTKVIGLRSTSFGPEFKIKQNLRTTKHVDDVNMRFEEEIDQDGKCRVNEHTFTNCGVLYSKLANGDAQMCQKMCLN